MLDMPSVYDLTPQRPAAVREWLIDSLTEGRYPVVMCPPNWPITAQ